MHVWQVYSVENEIKQRFRYGDTGQIAPYKWHFYQRALPRTIYYWRCHGYLWQKMIDSAN